MTSEPPAGRPVDERTHRSEFGIWLDAMMRARNLNRQDVGRRTGIHPSNISRYTTSVIPSPGQCRLLADALAIPYAEVLVQAGHIQNATELDERDPIRARLHVLVDTLAPEVLEPHLAILERTVRLLERERR
jgi:transcriptional regulator with XRE-family HTH domain